MPEALMFARKGRKKYNSFYGFMVVMFYFNSNQSIYQIYYERKMLQEFKVFNEINKIISDIFHEGNTN